MYTFTKLLSLLILIQLSQCAFFEDNLFYPPVVGIIKKEFQSLLSLLTGSLIRDDLVITSSRAVAGHSPSDFIVITYCSLLNPEEYMDEKNSVCIRKISKIIHAVGSHSENNTKNSIAILKLQSPFHSDFVDINTLANDIDDIDKNNCIYVEYKKSRKPWRTINKNVFWYDGPFNIESFTRESNEDAITALSESSFDFIEDQDEMSLFDMVNGSSKKKYFRYYESPDIYGSFDTTFRHYGAPVFCRLQTDLSPYVQVGVTNNYLQAFTPKKLIEVVYFINVIGRQDEIMAEIDEI